MTSPCASRPKALCLGVNTLIIIGGILLLLIAASTHRHVSDLNRKVVKLIMTIDELTVEVGNLGAQLNKALDEITRQIEALGTVPPALEAALNNAKAVAQSLDDLNPDE